MVEDLYNCPYFLGKKTKEEVSEELTANCRNNGWHKGCALFIKFCNSTNVWFLQGAHYQEGIGVNIYPLSNLMTESLLSLKSDIQMKRWNPWSGPMHSADPIMLRKSPFTLQELARAKVKANVSNPDLIEDLIEVEKNELKKLVISN